MKKISALIAILGLFSSQLYFVATGFLGLEYEGVENSSDYLIFNISVFLIVLLGYVFSLYKYPKINITESGFYIYFLTLILIHLAWILMGGDALHDIPDNLKFFVIFGIMGFMAARIVYAFDAWIELIKMTELIVIFMGIGIIFGNLIPRLSGALFLGIGGATYQAASYYSAVCFGVIVYSTICLNEKYRFRFFASKAGVVINLSLMMAMVGATVLNGGRGAFVLLSIYMLMALYWVGSRRGPLKFLFYFNAIVLFIVFFFQWFYFDLKESDSMLYQGLMRAIQFINFDNGFSIDITAGSSGRDEVYSFIVAAIIDSPLLGYGTFAHWDKIGQPHNLFLDLALQFGIPVGLMITLLVLALIIVNLRSMTVEKEWLFVIFLYPVTLLMFSGGYLRLSIFWFLLFSIFVIKNKLLIKSS